MIDSDFLHRFRTFVYDLKYRREISEPLYYALTKLNLDKDPDFWLRELDRAEKNLPRENRMTQDNKARLQEHIKELRAQAGRWQEFRKARMAAPAEASRPAESHAKPHA
ncbi:MAG: hypothetical protein GMKNLPBB_01755 [Myxococcota bacterium]|nr:hypothetical protein [Myxococcota bacterium]